ncbi:MAG: prolyl oligopeptidase family serine peptidase, partial [Candidatus Brocadiia bacterium]
MKTRRAILVIAFCSAIAALAWAAMHLSTDTYQPLKASPAPAVGPSLSVASNQSPPPSSLGTLFGEPSAEEAAAFADDVFITLRDKLPPLPADVAERMSSYRAELLSLPENPKSEAWRVGLLGQLDYLEYAVISGFQTERPEDKFREQLRAFKTGRDPYQLQSDSYVRGYVSPVDGTIAHYAVTLPPGYISTERYPLLISLHHHGWTDWFRPFQGCPAPQVEGAICISPHSRGSADYMWVALDETVAAIEDAIANYPIDPNRVYITGYSMGGTGSWNLAVHSPHLFAAIAPVAGNADFTAWVKRWNWRLESDSPFSFLRKYLRESTCPAAYAENLVNMPVLCYHGEGDTIVPVEHARGMTDRLKQLGYKNVDYRESAGGHFSVSITEIWPWLAGYTRNRFPSKVVCKTATL